MFKHLNPRLKEPLHCKRLQKKSNKFLLSTQTQKWSLEHIIKIYKKPVMIPNLIGKSQNQIINSKFLNWQKNQRSQSAINKHTVHMEASGIDQSLEDCFIQYIDLRYLQEHFNLFQLSSNLRKQDRHIKNIANESLNQESQLRNLQSQLNSLSQFYQKDALQMHLDLIIIVPNLNSISISKKLYLKLTLITSFVKNQESFFVFRLHVGITRRENFLDSKSMNQLHHNLYMSQAYQTLK